MNLFINPSLDVLKFWDKFAPWIAHLSQIKQSVLSLIPRLSLKYTSTKEEEESQGESTHPYPNYPVSQAALEGLQFFLNSFFVILFNSISIFIYFKVKFFTVKK